jgi:transcriptional regulator with PAS, ATPase and Fis domain
LRKHRFDKDAVEILSDYSWPGNVRQLRHVIEKLVATTIDAELITAEVAKRALPNDHLSSAGAQVPLLYQENDSLEAFLDRTLLTLYEQLLAKTGNHSQAARLLRIDRTSLYQRLERARRRVSGPVDCA